MSLMLIDLDNVEQLGKLGPANLDAIKVKAYHCTRAFIGDIKKYGLKVFDLDERLMYLNEVLLSHGISVGVINKYEIEIRNYISGMQLKARKGKICFCLNRGLFEEDNGCDHFFKYFGGEAMYRVADSDSQFSSIKNALQVIGEPLVVTASISLRTACSHQIDRIGRFISGESVDRCEVFIHENVMPKDILHIEVFNKDT